jgi:hypothetical protein
MATKYKPTNKQCPIRSSDLFMHVDHEWVFDNMKYSTQNTIQTRHVNGYVINRQAAFKWNILKFSTHSSDVREASAG